MNIITLACDERNGTIVWFPLSFILSPSSQCSFHFFFFFISLLTSYKIDRIFATNCMAFQETQFWESFFFLSPWLSYYIKKHMIGNMFRTGKLSKLLNRLALWLESSLKLWAKISNVDRMGRIFFFPSA